MLFDDHFLRCCLATFSLSFGVVNPAGTITTNAHQNTQRSIGPRSTSPGQPPDGQIAKVPIQCGEQFGTYTFDRPGFVACKNFGRWKYKCTLSTCILSNNKPASALNMLCQKTEDPNAPKSSVQVTKYESSYAQGFVLARGFKDGLRKNGEKTWLCFLKSSYPQNYERPKCKACRTFDYHEAPLPNN